MSVYAMIRNAYDPQSGHFILSENDIEMKGHLDGNLCRCTGYKPILNAIKTFVTEDLKGQLVSNGSVLVPMDDGDRIPRSQTTTGSCGRPGGCCKDSPGRSSCSSASSSSDGKVNPSSPSGDDASSSATSLSEQEFKAPSFPQISFRPYAPSTEIIFPPALRRFTDRAICYGDESKIWLRPVTLQQLLDVLSVCPSAKMVGGASEVQIEVRFKASNYQVSVYVADIPELAAMPLPEDPSTMSELVIGGNTPLSQIEAACYDLAPKLGQRGSVFAAIAKTLRYFAGRQIRNTASLAGNVATASPISDMNPLLMVSKATIVARTSSDEVALPMETLIRGYRKTALPSGSVITQIKVPVPPPNVRELTKAYKQAKRKDDDIAIVNASFRVRLAADNTVEDISIAYGGMAPTSVLAQDCAQALVGQPWKSSQTLHTALQSLEKTFRLPYGVPGGMATYRRTLALSLFFRFWHEVIHDLALGDFDPSLVHEIHRGISGGTRDDVNPHEQRVVGKQTAHLSGLKHTTGEAEYLDDIPTQHRQLYCAMVLSQKAHALLKSVDFTPALESGLAVGYVDHNNVAPERNYFGAGKDEQWFATDKVTSHGQVIGLVYAETAQRAQQVISCSRNII